jgi:class 3 adenylate cyclase
VVGNVGTAEQRSFTAIGDTTNVAARLQTVAATGEVVIGPRTREDLGETARVEPLEPLALKGKGLPVEAFRLIEAR